MRCATVAAFAAGAAGHGWMNEPPSRAGATLASSGICPYGSCLWFSQSCTIGCPRCLGASSGSGACGSEQGTATLPHHARTYDLQRSSCGINPWCAPGSSPIMNPCGIAGGDVVQGAPGNGGDAPPGYVQGYDGTQMPPLAGAENQRVWRAGDTVDVAWAVTANHGGGYQYRLCPKGESPSEACFQRTPLEFVGEEQWIQYCPYPEELLINPLPVDATPATHPPERYYPMSGCWPNRTTIPAVKVSSGTVPAGSTWMRNPVPACDAIAGGAFNFPCNAFQFPPAGPDLLRPGKQLGGFGSGACGGCNQPNNNNPDFCGINPLNPHQPGNCTDEQVGEQTFTFSIVDKVRVPNVPPGEYVVSFRWDCEQTPQIWSSCSDIVITGPTASYVAENQHYKRPH